MQQFLESGKEKSRVPVQRSKIVFYVNQSRYELSGPEVFLTFAEFVRYHLAMTGTKIVCAEGDCGACTVLVGSIHEAEPTGDPTTEPKGDSTTEPKGDSTKKQKGEGKLIYKAVNSCILPVYLLDCHHVITVEGLKRQSQLHPVQKAMIDCHGAQCGYCTPGIVCALAAGMEDLLLKNRGSDCISLSRKKAANFLTGNLCRCTGYEPILNAAESIDFAGAVSLQERYHDEVRNRELRTLSRSSVSLMVNGGVDSTEKTSQETYEETYEETSKKISKKISKKRAVHLPVTLQQAIELKRKDPDLRLIAGNTDFGVLVNKKRGNAEAVLSLIHLPELYQMKEDSEGIWIGARVTLTQAEKALQSQFPELERLLRIFASPQIKNQGTWVGNIVNASPIGDTLPALMILQAKLQIISIQGVREVPITQFYQGYKKLDLRPDEIVTRVFLPFPPSETRIKLYKVSLRKDLDISAVTFAGWVQIQVGLISDIRLSYGGVGPQVLRMTQLEGELRGKRFERASFETVADQIEQWVQPLSDHRGSKEYRLLLCRNLLLKFFDEVSGDPE